MRDKRRGFFGGEEGFGVAWKSQVTERGFVEDGRLESSEV